MVITVNGSCGLTATAANFNHSINSISSVANSLNKHSLAINGASNRTTNNFTTSLTSSLNGNRTTAFAQLPNQSIQSLSANQHANQANANYHSYLSNATATYGGHTRNLLNDELNVLTNMYQPTAGQHLTQNQMSAQLDLNSLQTNNTNQTQLAHLDQLHSIHPNSAFSLNNLNNLTAHNSQAHLLDQSTLHHHSFNDNLSDSSLNAPELSYDFSRLINCSSNRSKRKCANDESDSPVQQQQQNNHKSNPNKSSPQINQQSSQQVFEMTNQSINNNNKKLSTKNETLKTMNDLQQQLNDQRTNQSPRLNCVLTNQPSTSLMNNFLNNCTPNSSPNSAAGSEFNHHQHNVNTGLLAIAGSLNTPNVNSSLDGGLTNLMTTGHTADKTASTNLQTPISSLISSASAVASANLNATIQSTYSHQSTTNSLKLHIKTEPDEQQRDTLRSYTSVCTSDNNDSIYSPGALSNSTELAGYHSPTHNNLFGHVLNGNI